MNVTEISRPQIDCRPCIPILLCLAFILGLAWCSRGEDWSAELRATANDDSARQEVPLRPSRAEHSFDFETEQMEGTIRLDGPYHGVSRLIDKRTGRQLIDSRYSALNLFFLFSVNSVMGQPRTMERSIHVSPHWVEARWAATDAHQGEITARYEVTRSNAVDVTVTVRSQAAYAGYELFMPSYFDKALRPHVYLQPASSGRGKGLAADLVMPTLNDVFRGTLLAFPRDAHAARRCLDGRWDWDRVIQVAPVRRYAHCLAFQADLENQVAAVLMSHPRHCFAISARYHSDIEADRLTPYSAFDFSLFGDDILPGDEQSVRVRLALTEIDAQMSQPLQLYQAFLSEVAGSIDAAKRPTGKDGEDDR